MDFMGIVLIRNAQLRAANNLSAQGSTNVAPKVTTIEGNNTQSSNVAVTIQPTKTKFPVLQKQA